MSVNRFVYSELRQEIRKDYYFFRANEIREIQSKVKEYVESNHFPHRGDDGNKENWRDFLGYSARLIERNERRVNSLIQSEDLVHSKVVEAIKHEPYVLCPPAMKDLQSKIKDYIKSENFPNNADKDTTIEQWEGVLECLDKKIEVAEILLEPVVIEKEEVKLSFLYDSFLTAIAFGMYALHCMLPELPDLTPEQIKEIERHQFYAPHPPY